jgi:hypothetical protein
MPAIVEMRIVNAEDLARIREVRVDWPADFIWHTAVSPGSPDTIGV